VSAFWTNDEFAALLNDAHEGHPNENAVVEPGPTDIVRGDLFELGRHRLLCGDATSPADVTRLLDGRTPLLMATDPPYGVQYDPSWRHRVNPSQRTAVGAVTNDHQADWTTALRLFPGTLAYVWHAALKAGLVADSLQAAGFTIRSQIVWVKQHFALSRGDYHWAHEPAWYAVRTGRRGQWRGDRTQTTVWAVANLNPMGGSRRGENDVTGHSTQKPVALYDIPIRNHTIEPDAIYDPFCGSGTALIAAEKTGRTCLAIEIDPRYVQAAVSRWEAYAGKTAVRHPAGSTGQRRIP
jgi:DNA modification methylase